jgi:hypothetical protein
VSSLKDSRCRSECALANLRWLPARSFGCWIVTQTADTHTEKGSAVGKITSRFAVFGRRKIVINLFPLCPSKAVSL